MKYVMLITYCFDTDYVAVPCKDEAEAITVLNNFLNEEIAIIRDECEYSPHVLEFSDVEKILVYSDDEGIDADNYFEHDYAVYKVIEIGHNYRSK